VFDKFNSNFSKDKKINNETESSFIFPIQVDGLNEFFLNHSGCSFNQGLYRVHSYSDIDKWNNIVKDAFPEFSDRIYCFAYDWLGRQFSLDKARVELGEPLILMLEPGTGEVLEIPVNFIQFHEVEIIDYTNEVLAVEFFKEWLIGGKDTPKNYQCVGYKKPLFLGGSDVVDNLEISDLEVYWGLSGQILKQVRGCPTGTLVQNINIKNK